MKWYAISGSWRTTNEKLVEDITRIVKELVLRGDGIVTGGALGVDYIATQIVLEFGDPKKQLRLYLPIKLESFCKHYFKRAKEGVITEKQAEMVSLQLKKIEKIAPNSIFDEWGFKEANIESYYARNTKIVENCDELYAFQVNEGKGTQDAIDKAKRIGKPVHTKKYTIEK